MTALSVAVFISGCLGLLGATANVSARIERFLVTRDQTERVGLTLQAAMSAPVNIVREGPQSFIDNPLRYDYEAAFNALRALEPQFAVGSSLEMATFIFFPMIFFIYGCSLAVADLRHGLLKQRFELENPRAVFIGKMTISVVLPSVSILLATAILSGLAMLIRAFVESGGPETFPYAVTYSPTASNPVMQVAFSALVAVFFCLIGLFVGAASRMLLVPSLACILVLMMVPFAGGGDPRNLMATIGRGVFNYWSGFNPNLPLPADSWLLWTPTVVMMSALGAGSFMVWLLRSKSVKVG
ncbi:hypothetical protein [Sinomonas sp. ASV322]|uniref:hypothetical protein n=1 Tax=Sinomonas sp. ASV322 TaxID=3041920 RepID=UPI0027DE292A|nr:hypothetical protein [Sinomonas sp. ASV322]MDQ4502559.1 hypothetical protein [Sinomonas sp. ASV322]